MLRPRPVQEGAPAWTLPCLRAAFSSRPTCVLGMQAEAGGGPACRGEEAAVQVLGPGADRTALMPPAAVWGGSPLPSAPRGPREFWRVCASAGQRTLGSSPGGRPAVCSQERRPLLSISTPPGQLTSLADTRASLVITTTATPALWQARTTARPLVPCRVQRPGWSCPGRTAPVRVASRTRAASPQGPVGSPRPEGSARGVGQRLLWAPSRPCSGGPGSAPVRARCRRTK